MASIAWLLEALDDGLKRLGPLCGPCHLRPNGCLFLGGMEKVELFQRCKDRPVARVGVDSDGREYLNGGLQQRFAVSEEEGAAP